MTGLLYRIRIAFLAYAIAYVPMALWLAYEDHAGITVLIIPPLTITLAAIWLGWRFWAAIGDAYAVVTGWLARRRPAPTSLADYMPGSTAPQPRVNRAA